MERMCAEWVREGPEGVSPLLLLLHEHNIKVEYSSDHHTVLFT